MNKKDVAVVGVGYWGKNLARNYFELGSLHTICDHHLERLIHFKEQFSQVKITQDFQEVLKNPEIKKVIISVPTEHHFSLAKEALSAGKDVFVEKAMCETYAQAKTLVEIAKEKNRILMVGHLLHYHPGVAKVKEIVFSGELGDIYHCSFNRLNFGSVGAEGSALWAFAPHDISILLSIAKDRELKSFNARHKSFFLEKYVDQSWLHFEFSGGLSADIKVGWSYPYAERKFTIMGTKGMIVFDDLKEWEHKIILWRNQINAEDNQIEFKAQEGENISVEPLEPLKSECEHFLYCCETRTEPLSSGEEGLLVMGMLERAKETNISAVIN